MGDIWEKFKRTTQARIGLGRHGHAVATRDLIDFQAAHAAARDAVWMPWDCDQLSAALQNFKTDSRTVQSRVNSRIDYLQRPDLGRLLDETSAQSFGMETEENYEIAIAVTDGLSAKAIDRHFLPFWRTLKPRLDSLGYRYSPVALVPFGRVAIADDIGERLKARLSLIFVGERPGLSSIDSMGIYLTFGPRVGNNDARRNCISNIRPPYGLSYDLAADKLLFLIRESLRLGISGVDLKENAAPVLKDVDSESFASTAKTLPRPVQSAPTEE